MRKISAESQKRSERRSLERTRENFLTTGHECPDLAPGFRLCAPDAGHGHIRLLDAHPRAQPSGDAQDVLAAILPHFIGHHGPAPLRAA